MIDRKTKEDSPLTDAPSTSAPAPLPSAGYPDPPEEIELQCPECDYNLTGAVTRCPWCGWEIDAEALLAAASRYGGKRMAVMVAAGIAALTTVAAASLLFDFGRGLRWRDAAVMVAVALAAAGHVALAVAACFSRGVWPLRRGEVSAILVMLGLLSIAAAVTGATQTLGLAPTPLFSSTGAQVNGVFEFVLTATFFSLPGLALLALRVVSFRPRRHGATANSSIPQSTSSEERAPFLVQWMGSVSREQVEAVYRETLRPTNQMVERLIAESWAAAEAEARTGNRLLFNGPLIRLAQFENHGDRLRLEVGPTCYRDFVGTHFHNAGVIQATQPHAFAQALGVSVLPATRDHQLVLGRRSTRTAWHGGWLHPFGGMMEPTDRTRGEIDIFVAATRELCEELAILPDHVCGLMLIALVRDALLWQPELIFELQLAQSAKEIARGFDRRAADAEHDALQFLNDDPESIAAFLQAQSRLTPVGQAALLTHGRHHFGAEWYDRTCLVCYGNLPPAPKPDK